MIAQIHDISGQSEAAQELELLAQVEKIMQDQVYARL